MTTKDYPLVARIQGARDYLNGVKVGDNPYPPSNESHWVWMDGWVTAALNVAKVPRDKRK